jgi:hypothetical protein
MHHCNNYRQAHSRRDFLANPHGPGLCFELMDPLGLKANIPSCLRWVPWRAFLIYSAGQESDLLFQSGAPSQVDLFDHKPQLLKYQGQDLPASIRGTHRQTGMSAGQKIFPVVPSPYTFKPSGQSGAMISEMLPYTAQVADELTIIRSMYTEAINHDPAATS